MIRQDLRHEISAIAEELKKQLRFIEREKQKANRENRYVGSFIQEESKINAYKKVLLILGMTASEIKRIENDFM